MASKLNAFLLPGILAFAFGSTAVDVRAQERESLDTEYSIFVQIQGIAGSVRAKGYERWLEAESYGFEINREILTGKSGTGGAGAGKSTFSALKLAGDFTLEMPDLAKQAAGGQTLHRAKVHVLRRTGETLQLVTEILIERVLVQGLEVRASRDEGTEHLLALHFERVRFTSYPATTGQGKKRTGGWDRVANRSF